MEVIKAKEACKACKAACLEAEVPEGVHVRHLY